MKPTLLLLATLLWLTLIKSVAQTTCYKKANASGTNNGTSWTNAYITLKAHHQNQPHHFFFDKKRRGQLRRFLLYGQPYFFELQLGQ